MRRATDERGWIGLVTVSWATTVMLLSLLTLAAATDLLAARARAQTAADAAALAAVGASPLVAVASAGPAAAGASPPAGDHVPERQARRAAAANGAALLECRCDDLLTATVVAGVRPGMRWVAAVVPSVSAQARADLVGDAQAPTP